MSRPLLCRAAGLTAILGTAAITTFVPLAATAKEQGRLRCTIKGTAGHDRLEGTGGRDVICAKAGDDVVAALGGDDYVFAGGGKDRVDGGSGSDHLLGNRATDELSGGSGRDYLYGETGRDRLHGGPGKDELYGDLGGDRLDGGPGDDQVSGGPGDEEGDPYDQAGYPDCPDAEVCQFHLHLAIGHSCPYYLLVLGVCFGQTPYAPAGWAANPKLLPRTTAQWAWSPADHPSIGRDSFYNVIGAGYLGGFIPYGSTTLYTVGTGLNPKVPYVNWVTPGTRGDPGSVGGPLHFNWVSGLGGADLYLDGYLFASPR